MKPEARSRTVFSITQSKAKMYEYNVPLDEHITLRGNPAQLFSLTIGILGDLQRELMMEVWRMKKSRVCAMTFHSQHVSLTHTLKHD